MTNHLLRSHAPISDAGWELLDGEAKERMTPALGARRLVDFAGPHGWEHSATSLGRVTPIPTGPADGVSALRRRVLPVVELRADFELARSELRDADRGADDADLGALDAAARRIAIAENTAVFHGWADEITGIVQASPHQPGRSAARTPIRERSPLRSSSCWPTASAARTGSRSAATPTASCSGRPSTAASRCAST